MAKKKQKDFAKVKLKVGKRVKPANATSTEFKTKKVVVRTTPGLVSDPVHCLTACASSSSSIKLMHLSKLLHAPLLTSPSRITGDLLNALARLVLDSADKVRRQARLCVEQAIGCMYDKQLSLQHSIPILLTHVKCGLTHLDPSIASESRKLLSFLIAKSSPEHEQHFMQIVRTRIWDGKSVTLLDLELAAEILTKFYTESADHRPPVTMIWNPSNNHVSWSLRYEPLLSQSVDVTFSASSSTNDNGKELKELIAKVAFDGLSEFLKRSGDNVSLNPDQGRRLVALLKLSRCLSRGGMRSLTVPAYEVVGESSKRKSCSVLTRQIRELVGCSGTVR